MNLLSYKSIWFLVLEGGGADMFWCCRFTNDYSMFCFIGLNLCNTTILNTRFLSNMAWAFNVAYVSTFVASMADDALLSIEASCFHGILLLPFCFEFIRTLLVCHHSCAIFWKFIQKFTYLFCSLQIAVHGKSFNRSARDAWELFQSTGVEAIIAYDCSGAVLLMVTLLGGLITGTCSGVWTHIKWDDDRVTMVGSTAMLMGMVLVNSVFHWCLFWNW